MGELYKITHISGKAYIGIAKRTAAKRFYGVTEKKTATVIGREPSVAAY